MKQNGHLVYFGILLVFLIGFTVVKPELLYVTAPLAITVASFYFKFRPTSYFLYGMTGLTVFGVLVGFMDKLWPLWWLILTVIFLLSAIDLIFLFTRVKFSVERTLPGRFALGQYSEISLKISNLSSTGYKLKFFDGLPQESDCNQLPWEGFVKGKQHVKVSYDAKINERGWTEFTETHLETFGPFRLWSRIYREGEKEKVRVYPNYEPVLQLSLMSMESNPEQMGIKNFTSLETITKVICFLKLIGRRARSANH